MVLPHALCRQIKLNRGNYLRTASGRCADLLGYLRHNFAPIAGGSFLSALKLFLKLWLSHIGLATITYVRSFICLISLITILALHILFPSLHFCSLLLLFPSFSVSSFPSNILYFIHGSLALTLLYLDLRSLFSDQLSCCRPGRFTRLLVAFGRMAP